MVGEQNIPARRQSITERHESIARCSLAATSSIAIEQMRFESSGGGK